MTVAVVLVGWAALVVAAAVWGRHIPTHHLHLGTAPPLIGQLRDHPRSWTLLPAAVLGLALALAGPRLARTLHWRGLLALTWVSSAAWAVALAASDGWTRVSEPLTTRFEYLAVIPRIGSDPLRFIRHFTANLPSYPTHVKGHGPLASLPFWLLSRLHLPQPASSAALVIAVGASGLVAVAVTIRVLADETTARRVAPFLVLLPAALWIATSADAMFLGVSAWGIALLAIAGARSDRRGDLVAALSGLLIGLGLLMSYGLLVLLAVPPTVAVLQHRVRPLLLAGAAAGLLVALLAVAGFSYLAGYHATHAAWAAGWGPQRSRVYFLLADLADLAILVGPAAAAAASAGSAALTEADRRVRWLLIAAVVAVAASDASGFVRGEAERIWLPFAPWVALTTARPRWRPRTTSLALIGQAGVAIAVQAFVRSPW